MKKRRPRLSFCEPDSSRDSILNLPSNRLDELFTFWKLEGAGIAKGAAITIWRFKPITNQIVSTMGITITISYNGVLWPMTNQSFQQWAQPLQNGVSWSMTIR